MNTNPLRILANGIWVSIGIVFVQTQSGWKGIRDGSDADFRKSNNEMRHIYIVMESCDPWGGCQHNATEQIKRQMSTHRQYLHYAHLVIGYHTIGYGAKPEQDRYYSGDAVIMEFKDPRAHNEQDSHSIVHETVYFC